MKEYKTVSIKIDEESHIEDQLNEFAKDGWSFVQIITKHLNHDNGCAEFIYILERENFENGYWERVSGAIGSESIRVKSNNYEKIY